MVVGVDRGHLVGLVLGEALDALVGLEVVLDPEPLAVGVDPHVGVAGVPVHVPPRARDAAVAHQPGHLVRRLRRQRPEVPLHVVVAQVVRRAALLRADEVLELHRVADEEHRRVVADEVEVALAGVELHRETARVAPRVGAAALPRHGREPDQHVGLGAGLEHRGAGEGADVLGHLERPERAATLGVRLPLRDALPVEVRHLLDQVVILQQQRAVRPDGQRVLVAGDRYPAVGRGRSGLLGGHTKLLNSVMTDRGTDGAAVAFEPSTRSGTSQGVAPASWLTPRHRTRTLSA